MGLQYVKNNAEGPIFSFMNVYALTLYHKTDTCVVRKISVDFLSQTSSVLCGKDVLSRAEALNRTLGKLP